MRPTDSFLRRVQFLGLVSQAECRALVVRRLASRSSSHLTARSVSETIPTLEPRRRIGLPGDRIGADTIEYDRPNRLCVVTNVPPAVSRTGRELMGYAKYRKFFL